MFLVWESTSKSTFKKQDDRMIDVCLFLLSMCRSPHVERIGWFPTRNSENLFYLWQDPTRSFACKFIECLWIIGYDMNSNLLTLDDLYWILDEFVFGFYIDKGCDVFDIGHINVFTPDDSRF